MGTQPTTRASLALLALAHALVVHAEPPALSVPELNLSSTIVRTLGLRAQYPVDKLGQSGCERELTRIRGAEVASIGGRPVTMGAAASLYFLNGRLGQVPTQEQLHNVGRFFSEGVKSMQPEKYRLLQRDLREIRMALEDRAGQLGTTEAKELTQAFKSLERLVGNAKLDAESAELKATTDSKNYEGAKDLFKTIEEIRAELPKVMQLAGEAEAATASGTAAATITSAEAELFEVGATGATGGGAGAAEAESAAAAEAESQTVSRTAAEATMRGSLGRGMILGGNIFLGILGLASLAMHAFDTPEKQARELAAEGAKVADAWKNQPEASDAYVFSVNVKEVCTRAVKDPKGFGMVVSQKMGAIEYWDALSKSIKLQKYLKGFRSQTTMASVIESPDKFLGGAGDPVLSAGLRERSTGEQAL